MENIKSLDYLQEIKKDNIMTNENLVDMLQNIAYILADNGYEDARYFIDDIMDKINDGEINL